MGSIGMNIFVTIVTLGFLAALVMSFVHVYRTGVINRQDGDFYPSLCFIIVSIGLWLWLMHRIWIMGPPV